MSSGRSSLEAALHDIAARASDESGGFAADMLSAYLDGITTAWLHGGGLGSRELRHCRTIGSQAAVEGIELPMVVDAFLSATRLVWEALPALHESIGQPVLPAQRLLELGQLVLRAADDALASVAEGYAQARRAVIRQEESLRREFVDDVLAGAGDVSDLVARADRVGLRLTAAHLVAVVASRPALRSSGLALSSLEERLRTRLAGRDLLIAMKESLIVIVVGAEVGNAPSPSSQRKLADLIGRQIHAVTRTDPAVTVALGREHTGPAGVAMSYREAREALGLAAQVGWPNTVVLADELAVYQVLLRDTEALTSVVEAVRKPLTAARGGAQPLLDTLATFFACGAVATETARQMHLSVRAVTYRLSRIATLTGYRPTDPADWLTLQIAAVGARLLGLADKAGSSPSLPDVGNDGGDYRPG